MKYTCYLNHVGGPGNVLLNNISRSINAEEKMIQEQYDPKLLNQKSFGFVWGILRGSYECIQDHIKHNYNYVYLDHAYFNRGHENKTYRFCLNGFQQNYIIKAQDNKLRKYNIQIQPWKKGTHILICPPSKFIKRVYNNHNWEIDTLEKLKKITDRPIKIRNKKNDIPLLNDLQDCHALVTFNSNAAVEAIVHGVPAFVNSCSSASTMMNVDINNIENPIYHNNRFEWVCSLTYGQFSFDELKNKNWLPIFLSMHKEKLLPFS